MMKFFSIDNIANIDNLSWCIVLCKDVFIYFKVEKHLSGSAVDIGIVIIIFNSFMLSPSVPVRFSDSINDSNETAHGSKLSCAID